MPVSHPPFSDSSAHGFCCKLLIGLCIVILMFTFALTADASDMHDYPTLEGAANTPHDSTALFRTDSQVHYTATRLTQKTLQWLSTETNPNGIEPYHYASLADDRQSFWVLTEERVSRQGDEPDAIGWLHNEWLRYDFNGQLVEVANADHDSRKLLGTSLPITNDYHHPNKLQNNASDLVSFKAFKKHRFIWGSLNPLRDWGNPTGATPNRDWDGSAEMILHLGNSHFDFSLPTQSTTSGHYQFTLEAYRLPARFPSALLYIKTRPWGKLRFQNIPEGLYLITCEDC